MLIIIAVAQDAHDGPFHHSFIKGVERDVDPIIPTRCAQFMCRSTLHPMPSSDSSAGN